MTVSANHGASTWLGMFQAWMWLASGSLWWERQALIRSLGGGHSIGPGVNSGSRQPWKTCLARLDGGLP